MSAPNVHRHEVEESATATRDDPTLLSSGSHRCHHAGQRDVSSAGFGMWSASLAESDPKGYAACEYVHGMQSGTDEVQEMGGIVVGQQSAAGRENRRLRQQRGDVDLGADEVVFQGEVGQ